MKKIFATTYHYTLANIWLLIFRVAVSAFMLTHGYDKFNTLVKNEPIKFADPFSIGMYPSFLLVVFSEFFCSIFIILGVGTRIASIFLIVTMAVAAFYAHADDPFAKKEIALAYFLMFFTILVFGPGKYSLDHLIGGKSKSTKKY